ncbi:hypothetical protein SLE2022_391200 [Rubroshorea leprosula]
MSTSAAAALSSSSSKICYNAECTELKSERPRKGWRLRTGEFAELCDRCGIAYEEGRFCDAFHSNAPGWSSCKSCGKRVHCGCIVSAHAFTLLDPGGIECVACAGKNVVLGQNVPWSGPLFFQSSVKSWSHLAGSGPVSWQQAPTLFNSSASQPEFHPRVPYEVDLSTGIERLGASEKPFFPSPEKRKMESFPKRRTNGSLKFGTRDIHENVHPGINGEEEPWSCSNKPQQPSLLKQDQSNPQFGLASPHTSQDETNSQQGVASNLFQSSLRAPLAKQFHGSQQNGLDSLNETQIHYGRLRPEALGRNQLFSQFWPRFTDQDLQQITGDSNSIITPLFEKMLSASDAGRNGRLVLPKKCAEAYFPPISQPEGLPLKVQDAKGKEWIFQLRFWPNNNSRMYVLEGVTPCIQNMQLQAGDVVTFSRLEPGGKLFMGYRKASTAPASNQDNEGRAGNGVSVVAKVDLADPTSWSKVDKAKDALEAKPMISRKRKNSMLVSKSKHLKIDNEDLIELKITWEDAQGLLRPPPNHIPSIVVIEGFEFEEYKDAPILGKPKILVTDNAGEKFQWVECEDCFKWRKLPASTLLPSRWTCSSNSWDPSRSSCSAAEELSAEQLEDLLLQSNSAASEKMKAAKREPDSVDASEGLDTLANLAILEDGEALPASSQATTRHPRHRPGCSCIVCIQPPSGKGPKHKQTCTCNVCQTVKRRFHTLMLRREKKQSQKESETERKKHQPPLPEKLLDDDCLTSSNAGNSSPNPKRVVSKSSDDDPSKTKSSSTPFKGQIDLNIQPEKEEEPSLSDSSSMMKLLQDPTERYLRQQELQSSGGTSNSGVTQTQPD